MNLNQEQIEAVQHVDGPCLVISCPGSGKTRILTERVACLVKEGYSASNILCLTFTNKAANEMKERICKRLGIEKYPSFIGTFHALCSLILRKFADRIGYTSDFIIFDQKDQKDLIAKMARQLQLDLEKSQITTIMINVNTWRENLEDNSNLEQRFQEHKKGDDLLLVAKAYLEKIKKSNIVDFSGLLYECVNLLKENKDVLDMVQNKCSFLQIDEAQDTNIIQFELIRLLSSKTHNVMLTGDTSQSIYQFRNSRYQNILDFLDENPNCKQITLKLNYRSTPQIIDKACNLIINNTSHMSGRFETCNEDGENVICRSFHNQIQEAEWVSHHIKKLIEEGGWDEKDIAILYRINSLSRSFESSLSNLGIKYKVIGGFSFYDRAEIRDCLSILKFFINKKDNVSFHRVAQIIKGLGNITVGKIENLSESKNISLLEACKLYCENNQSTKTSKSCQKIIDLYDNIDLQNPAEILEEFIKRIDYYSFLAKKYNDQMEYEIRKDNVVELVNSIAIYYEEQGGDLSKYLQNISLMTSEDEDKGDNVVSLMTMHAAKGLEFPIVFTVGIEQGIVPHNLAIIEMGEEGYEEERRILYVAMTRSKKLLYMTYCKNRKTFLGKKVVDKQCKPSQFLIEAKL